MSENKFRAWDRKRMVYFDLYDLALKGPTAFLYAEGSSFAQYDSSPKKKDLKISRFTGLHSDNCRKVFGGDIVRVSHDEEYSNDQVTIVIEEGKEKWEIIGEVQFNSYM